MKFFYSIILLLAVSILPACAKDDIYYKGNLTTGKIFAYSDGLIQIQSGGVSYSFVRSKNSDYYGDKIVYRERPILGGTVSTNCRILFIDRFYVVYKTEHSERIEVPRYRVSSIVLNAD